MAAQPRLRGPARESRQPQIPPQRDHDRGSRSRHRSVNLSLAEIAELPLAAALVDAAGAVIARTPAVDGPGPGAVSYPVRSVRLVVRTQPASAQCDELLSRLLDSIDAAATALSGAQAQRVRMLGGSLRLVAGREPGGGGDTDDVIEIARSGITAPTGLTREGTAAP